ncbi:amino acid adenylation domain-containing protein [Clostridium sp. 'deep sea']|uniref:amino acid adenylation domain-containing protein n=1 Tax=Clostridium sp. 'deep sea' TaxID=2779445 RepID=UPI0018969584|nr:amino acid adenylation domain-containing protein [Clostridium sp. 'deep sea']QOR35246.1 amino acid adenylation domain-containing protein [Clostridium sp. 'deep sea']
MTKTIIDFFENTALKYRSKIAVGDKNASFTYEQLMEKAQKVGAVIAEKGFIKRPIAILMNRTCKLPATMLGVLYSGNFYVVLDSNSTFNRQQKIVDILRPSAVIYESQFNNIVNQLNGEFVKLELEKIEPTANGYKKLNKAKNQILSTDPAFSIFTSGSTGFPKGVLITHQNVISYIDWFTTSMKISSNTVFGSQTPLHFSMSVSDLFATLAKGGTYHMIPKEYFVFPAKLIEFMNERNVNTIYWVPTALAIVAKFNLFKYTKPTSLNKVLFAGEVMPIKYLNYWRSYLPNVMYANLFGPTETTDICTYYVVNREFEDTESLPIGSPCENCCVYLINEQGEQVADGDIGELYVSGAFVAKGYYNNYKKTKESFVQNPLQSAYPELVYKTGDLARKNEYGELEYLGRKDFQIKRNGYRIELGEIQAAFAKVKGIELSVCLYDEKQQQIVLVYEGATHLKEQLKKVANQKLPAYMRPDKYIATDCFPKNANGKISKKLLKNII